MSFDDEEEFVCVLSERTPRDDEIVYDAPDDDDLGEMPVGWMRITIERRGINPEWVHFQEAKNRMIMGQLSQMDLSKVTAEQKAMIEHDVALAITAQLLPMEQSIPKYVTAEEEVYIFPPEADAQVGAAWGEIAEALEVAIGTPGEYEDLDDDDDDDAEDGDDDGEEDDDEEPT